MKKLVVQVCLFVCAVAVADARATDRLCDPANEDCRAILLGYIEHETVGIDVGFWFMEDARYTAALAAAHNRGVRIRVLVDPRANASTPLNVDRLAELQTAGIPMRKNISSGILHYKMMLFAGQAAVEFSGANFSANAWTYTGTAPYVNYTDESVYFTDDPPIVESFMSRFDTLWVDVVRYTNYANIAGPLAKAYPAYAISPDLDFPPSESYASRAVAAYNAETQKIDAIMYRITDQRHTNALISAFTRGVPVRLISEPQQYRDPKRLWDAWNIDRMYVAGIPIRMRAHQGLSHQKLVLLYGSGLSIFGSSNWTSPSDRSQEEHNYFSPKPAMFQWFVAQFERKWNNSTGVAETSPFVPLPPDQPKVVAPASNATGVATSSVALTWYGGPWAHRYDVYLGPSAGAMQPVLLDANLGPSDSATKNQIATVTALTPGTTYYWKVVSRTVAGKTSTSPTWAFTTAPAPAVSAPQPGSGAAGTGDIVLYATDGRITGSAWTLTNDPSTSNGARLWNPDHAAAKLAAPLAAPASYVDFTFTPVAGTPYHLWLRAEAQNNDYRNDSLFLQYSGTVDGAGSPIYRIGTISGEPVSLENCTGAGVAGWGWQDDLYCGTAPALVFSGSGPQTIRLQQREDGVSVDEILLSPSRFLTTAPGALKNDTTVIKKASTTTVSGTAPAAADVVLYAADGRIGGTAWQLTADTTAAGGSRLWNPDRGAAKIVAAASAPASDVEFTFNAVAGTPYRLWMRARADNDGFSNDSLFLQFDGSVTAAGAASNRIGTTAASVFSLEACSGAGEHGWGWEDTMYCGNADPVYFATTGPQKIRIQQREDGISIDQIVLSPQRFLSVPPGAQKDDATIVAR